MRKYFLVLILCLVAGMARAQRFGYIDSEYILDKMPEYAAAKTELDKLSAGWQTELEEKQQQLYKLRSEFEAEKILLTEEMKQKRLAVIEAKEKEVRDFQNQMFGFDGMIFKKREELLKPVLDKLSDAAAKVARKRKLAILFDKASDLSMVYTHPDHDYTDIVMEELGLVKKQGADK